MPAMLDSFLDVRLWPMLSKKSKIEHLAKSRERRFSAPSAATSLSRIMYEALWSPSYDPMWSPPHWRVGRTSGAEKFSSPTAKCFFDSIGPTLPTLAVHQVASYLGNTGRDVDIVSKAARDRPPTASTRILENRHGQFDGVGWETGAIANGLKPAHSPRLC